jgi:hypothetical protein
VPYDTRSLSIEAEADGFCGTESPSSCFLRFLLPGATVGLKKRESALRDWSRKIFRFVWTSRGLSLKFLPGDVARVPQTPERFQHERERLRL